MKAFDTAESTQGKAHELVKLGYQAVGLYARPDRTSAAEIQGLHSVGIKVWLVYEKGQPTSPAYFTQPQGTSDGQSAVEFARSVSCPLTKPIFFAVDYDANPQDVLDYFIAVHDAVRSRGYWVGVYGSGAICKELIDNGLAHYGWLAQSKGWQGYSTGNASIIQGPSTTILGMNCDSDTVIDGVVTW